MTVFGVRVFLFSILPLLLAAGILLLDRSASCSVAMLPSVSASRIAVIGRQKDVYSLSSHTVIKASAAVR